MKSKPCPGIPLFAYCLPDTSCAGRTQCCYSCRITDSRDSLTPGWSPRCTGLMLTKKERLFKALLALVIAICFWITALAYDSTESADP